MQAKRLCIAGAQDYGAQLRIEPADIEGELQKNGQVTDSLMPATLFVARPVHASKLVALLRRGHWVKNGPSSRPRSCELRRRHPRVSHHLDAGAHRKRVHRMIEATT